jgi:threonine aldolase
MNYRNRRGFASDNNSGVHPAIMEAMMAANHGHVVAYGDDPYTDAATAEFKRHFGEKCVVFFVFLGTGANVLGLKAAVEPFNAVICAESAHINVDECGAPEAFTGCKLLSVATRDGKLSVKGIEKHMHGFGFEHHAQPKVVSITQPTELGTVYQIAEIREIAQYVHAHGMLLHMDGARLANAAVHLGVELGPMTRDAGVDILSFGGTKNGMMYGEAVVFFRPELAVNFKYTRKQGMQLASKMRFIAAQFKALLSNGLWAQNAARANQGAQRLASRIAALSGIVITQRVQTNALFATLPQELIAPLQREFFFYIWDETRHEVRWMTSFDTENEDIDRFAGLLREMALQKT